MDKGESRSHLSRLVAAARRLPPQNTVATAFPQRPVKQPMPVPAAPLLAQVMIPDVPDASYALLLLLLTAPHTSAPRLRTLRPDVYALAPFAPGLPPLFGVLSPLPPIAHALVLELFVMLRDLRPDAHTLAPFASTLMLLFGVLTPLGLVMLAPRLIDVVDLHNRAAVALVMLAPCSVDPHNHAAIGLERLVPRLVDAHNHVAVDLVMFPPFLGDPHNHAAVVLVPRSVDAHNRVAVVLVMGMTLLATKPSQMQEQRCPEGTVREDPAAQGCVR